jgi:GT2 family glycosyltransferase
VVIVTYNSGATVVRTVRSLFAGSRPPDEVVVVDNASRDDAPLDELEPIDRRVRLAAQPSNLGFCAGNNVGYRLMAAHPFVLFLNPDAFVSPAFIERALVAFERDVRMGALGPKLLTVDARTLTPTGNIDSTGIFQTSYGRWFDRGRGQADDGRYDGAAVDVPALCGAALFCRRAALAEVAPDGAVFDESFFMYKEDIDLSLRLTRAGWRVVFDPALTVQHVRGSTADRRSMPSWARRRSLTNEWRIWRKGYHPASRLPTLGYLAGKSVLVLLGR